MIAFFNIHNRGLSIQIRDGGNVENVTYSNIIIETRGIYIPLITHILFNKLHIIKLKIINICRNTAAAEAHKLKIFNILTFNRDENTKSGRIRNIRFFNVTAKGENGVLIHGNADNVIEDITFENCRVELTKTSKWDCGLYDLRPCLDWGVEKYDNSAFFLRYVKDITIMKTKTMWGNLCSSYKHAIDAENVENLEFQTLC